MRQDRIGLAGYCKSTALRQVCKYEAFIGMLATHRKILRRVAYRVADFAWATPECNASHSTTINTHNLEQQDIVKTEPRQRLSTLLHQSSVFLDIRFDSLFLFRTCIEVVPCSCTLHWCNIHSLLTKRQLYLTYAASQLILIFFCLSFTAITNIHIQSSDSLFFCLFFFFFFSQK